MNNQPWHHLISGDTREEPGTLQKKGVVVSVESLLSTVTSLSVWYGLYHCTFTLQDPAGEY